MKCNARSSRAHISKIKIFKFKVSSNFEAVFHERSIWWSHPDCVMCWKLVTNGANTVWFLNQFHPLVMVLYVVSIPLTYKRAWPPSVVNMSGHLCSLILFNFIPFLGYRPKKRIKLKRIIVSFTKDLHRNFLMLAMVWKNTLFYWCCCYAFFPHKLSGAITMPIIFSWILLLCLPIIIIAMSNIPFLHVKLLCPLVIIVAMGNILFPLSNDIMFPSIDFCRK